MPESEPIDSSSLSIPETKKDFPQRPPLIESSDLSVRIKHEAIARHMQSALTAYAGVTEKAVGPLSKVIPSKLSPIMKAQDIHFSTEDRASHKTDRALASPALELKAEVVETGGKIAAELLGKEPSPVVGVVKQHFFKDPAKPLIDIT